MTRRLLLVEPSATMRHALTTHVSALGFELDVTETYEAALEAIESRFKAFGADIEALIFGWPASADDDAEALADRLESDDIVDLPVVVMSTDSRAATRAWSAARARTSLLPWKDYLDIETQLADVLEQDSRALERLVPSPETARHPAGGRLAGDSRAGDESAGELHVLLVDASGAVRDALRDLLVAQGYKVSVAATSIEALTLARNERVDMVLLDFYLEDATADTLCSELVTDPSFGGPLCLVLTKSCAEPIVRRCLAAGALDCLFKNEPNELLLARIDAFGRTVRSRRALAARCDLLQRTYDRLAGSSLLLDAEGRVRHATPAAFDALSLPQTANIVGMTVEELCGIEAVPSAQDGDVRMTWRLLAQDPLDVSVRRKELADSDESYLVFERADEATSQTAETLGSAASEGQLTAARAEEVKRIADVLALDSAGEGFVGCLVDYLKDPPTAPDMVSLLVLGVHVPAADGHRELGDGEANHATVQAGLARLYRREHHVAPLGGHRFGFLIRHVDEPQSYLLTRRLMQMCNDRLLAQGARALATNACLVGLSRHAGASAEVLLQTSLRGLVLAESRGVDKALLLDLERMLPVYPDNVAGESDDAAGLGGAQTAAGSMTEASSTADDAAGVDTPESPGTPGDAAGVGTPESTSSPEDAAGVISPETPNASKDAALVDTADKSDTSGTTDASGALDTAASPAGNVVAADNDNGESAQSCAGQASTGSDASSDGSATADAEACETSVCETVAAGNKRDADKSGGDKSADDKSGTVENSAGDWKTEKTERPATASTPETSESS